MKLTLQEIFKFACTESSNKSFVDGESVLNAGHVIKCGQVPCSDCNIVSILAFCLQTSHIKDNPHEITGEILKDGRIIGMGCSCKGDLSGTCKHIIAVLLYCNRNDLESLQMITYTDKKCIGNQPHKSSLEKYEAKPLDEHECFSMSRKKILNTKYRKKNPYETKANDDNTKSKDSDESFQLSEEENTKIRNLMVAKLESSALALHIIGRHEAIQISNNN